MTWTAPAITVGWILALLALILCVVLAVVGQLEFVVAGLIGLVALARLL